jgi:NADH-quinone oxidoreductase subunit E
MISETLQNQFDELLKKYPQKRSALIPMLLCSQEEFGFITDECIEQISQRLGLPTINIREVISFYSMLRLKPAGKFHIQVCTNISCLLLGGENLLHHISKKLGIKPGEVTPDRLFSLVEVECLGACCNAPAMQINYEYYEDLTLSKVDQILDQLQSKSASLSI